MLNSFFSSTYSEARGRFLSAASGVGAKVHSYAIDAEAMDELAMDVAIVGEDEAPTILVSSGVHGVEGFLGSAVQLSLLERIAKQSTGLDVRYVLVHAVNPFGFSHLRRFNEDNVDLNRNFLFGDVQYEGSPAGYARLDAFLNPPSVPSRFEPFKLLAMLNILRYGRDSLIQSVAGGQYDYPRGVFFGGHGPCQSTRLVHEHARHWISESRRVVHIDFHSGLGAFGAYQLLITDEANSINVSWYADTFGAASVHPRASRGVAPYVASGEIGVWLRHHFSDLDYRFVTAEYGTYDSVRVLAAIRTENCAHHYASPKSEIYHAAKRELLECFCPRDASWRSRVIETGERIINQAVESLA